MVYAGFFPDSKRPYLYAVLLIATGFVIGLLAPQTLVSLPNNAKDGGAGHLHKKGMDDDGLFGQRFREDITWAEHKPDTAETRPNEVTEIVLATGAFWTSNHVSKSTYDVRLANGSKFTFTREIPYDHCEVTMRSCNVTRDYGYNVTESLLSQVEYRKLKNTVGGVWDIELLEWVCFSTDDGEPDYYYCNKREMDYIDPN